MNKRSTLSISTVIALLATSAISADEVLPKQSLKANYQVTYNKLPKSVDNISEMFQDGMFYGRLRSNTFLYEWEKETSTQDSHVISAIGGSLAYKSATFKDFDFTAALYYSKAFFNEDNDPVDKLKPGYDLLSRYDFINGNGKSMTVLGQAYITYKGLPKTEINLGRQLVDTFYVASNDTKMIPNTFDGVTLQTKALPDTTAKLAYLTEEKLRGHTDNHSVLAYGDSSSSSGLKPIWDSNDDSAMHKGLTYTNLRNAGVDTDAPLITGDLRNKSIKNLTLDTSFYTVPDLVSEVMAEANYKINLDGFSLSPGVRYIKQFDNGAGEIGGASYSGKLAGKVGASGGYKDASSLDSQMVAARLVGAYKNYNLNLGYSQVLDEADLITPWRGFPTAGYTRSMARYNWMANTKSYRAELNINQNKTGVYRDLLMQFSVLHTDADEAKGYFDENYYYAGFVQNIPSFIDLQWRLRLGYADTKQVNADSLDARFELNYLF
ncbi:MAG: OprD family outer membrane porin [Sulfurimonas sp.]|uniref:OprD family outer membrane porin n=1 Tax=Sulfurimonas sp. TaxID=2022749 RepID=UPI00262B3138|nr:OprD family outer membrane porin [Sulfurimonas sp.]MDD2652189.1 OprD family outer membrane porin [Sulfurimonas sp.]MDD3450528.1 OprD family outer membrane porin [Sulfurimonas sp.]